MARRPKPKTLRAVHPNAGTRAAYQRRLDKMITAMNRSVVYWMTAAYRANEPRMVAMAADATPAIDLTRAMAELTERWLEYFDTTAPSLAEWFATDSAERSDAALQAALRKGGFTVKFRMTPAAKDIIEATVSQNVSLIRSIPREYLTQVEGMVMRSVTAGRDIGGLAAEIEQQFGVTKRRAATIARSQNNMATSAIQKARQLEIGLEKGIWMHSGGGKEPRPKHVAADGEEFDLKKGLKIGDKGQWVMPGIEPGCKCVWRAVVPGF